MNQPLDRRQFVQLSAAGITAAAAASLASPAAAHPGHHHESGIRFCLNTSTIRGQELSIEEEIDIAAKAGYEGIEPWLNKLQKHHDDGKSLSDLRKRIADHGLKVESAIGFAQWILPDEAKRKEALEQAKRDMDLVAAIGGTRMAAPPSGATKGDKLNLLDVAARYHDLLEVGRAAGVVPMLELWGFSANLHRLGEVVMVVVEANHPDACMMPDVYHIYKGGSEFDGLKSIHGSAIPVFHMNDYPADPPRETINDAARVFPGDGVAPLKPLIQDLVRNGFRGVFSLELFNPQYWQRDALAVAQEGLEKMRGAVEEALG